MDKDLITRVVLVVVTVALYLVGFHPTIAAPIAVAIVALVMFWPRPREEREQRLPIQLEEQGEK